MITYPGLPGPMAIQGIFNVVLFHVLFAVVAVFRFIVRFFVRLPRGIGLRVHTFVLNIGQ
jgi:hypothetical protein